MVLLATLISGIGTVFAALSWRRILSRYGVRQAWREDLRIYCYAALGVAIPGGIWSIAGRTVMYNRVGADGVSVATASVIETFVVGMSGLVLYVICSLVRPDIAVWQRPEPGMLVAAIILLLLHPRIFNRLSRWMLRQARLSSSPLQAAYGVADLLGWLALEATVLVTGSIALYALLASLTPTSLEMLPRIIAAWAAAAAISSLLFWLPGTPVLRDGAMVLALVPSLPLPLVVVYIVLVRVWSIVALLVFAGLAWLFLEHKSSATRSEATKL